MPKAIRKLASLLFYTQGCEVLQVVHYIQGYGGLASLLFIHKAAESCKWFIIHKAIESCKLAVHTQGCRVLQVVHYTQGYGVLRTYCSYTKVVESCKLVVFDTGLMNLARACSLKTRLVESCKLAVHIYTRLWNLASLLFVHRALGIMQAFSLKTGLWSLASCLFYEQGCGILQACSLCAHKPKEKIKLALCTLAYCRICVISHVKWPLTMSWTNISIIKAKTWIGKENTTISCGVLRGGRLQSST